MHRVVTAIVLGVLVLLSPLAAAAQTSTPPGAAHAPLVWGWERFFTVTWEPMESKGRRYVAGYVSNDWGHGARRIQLLVDGLDASGRVVNQDIHWLGQSITPGSRVYFEVPAQPAASYRVRVFAFDWMQASSVEAP